MPTERLTDGARHLAKRDPVMKRLIAEHGLPDLGGRRTGRTRFEQLAEAICYQQLAGKAAEAIWNRVRVLVDGPFTPEGVLAIGHDALRGAGFTNAKALSLLDLASKVASGDVRLDRIGRLSDEAVVAELTPVRGIGPWTAEMFLIFTLKRLDVWPVGDYGVRAGYAVAYDLTNMPSPQELVPLGDRFRPYRTMVAWYCWQALIASRDTRPGISGR
jgi:3-methyladenine DNA glycosylase/8-oxoguanine DNA glycosylase